MIRVSCHQHPRYTAKQWPKAHCRYCEMLYVLVNAQHHWEAKRQHKRKAQ